MKTKLIVLSAVMSLAAAASAETAFETLLNADRMAQTLPAAVLPVPAGAKPVKAGAGKRFPAFRNSSPSGLIDSVMTAMYDQPGTAETLVEWLRGHKCAVEFRDTGLEASAHAWLSGQKIPAVYLSPAAMTPVSYRYLGVLIAREAGELMLADFPESAEKRYMIASRMGETFFELGGTRSEMANMDGHSDAKVEESIRLWVENDPAGGVSVLKQRGVNTLNDLEGGLTAEYERLLRLEQAIDQMLVVPNDPNAPSLQAELDRTREEASAALAKLDAVKAARAQFEEFSKDESAWFQANQGSLQ